MSTLGAASHEVASSVLKRRSQALVLMMPLVLAACRDTTAPPGTVQVVVTADGTPAPEFIDTPNRPLIQCTYGLTATAAGRGTSTWAGGQTLCYVGPDRATPVDTTSNPASSRATARAE
jgi:hypothetical protein